MSDLKLIGLFCVGCAAICALSPSVRAEAGTENARALFELFSRAGGQSAETPVSPEMPVTTSPAKNALKPAAKPDVVKLRPGAVKPDAAKPDVATPVPGAVGPENKDQNLSDAIKKQSSEDDKSKLASSTGGSTVLSMAASVLKGVVFIGVGFYAAYKFLESNSPDTIAKVLSWTRKGGTSLPVPAGKKK